MSNNEDIRLYYTSKPFEVKETGIESVVSWLRTVTVIDFVKNTVVQPVTNECKNSVHDLCVGLVNAWRDRELRQGYLPTTPSSIVGAESVIAKWIANPSKVVYIYGPEGSFLEIGWAGYLTLEIVENRGSLVTEWTYGLFSREFSGLGYTTNAVHVVLNMVEEACFTFGCPLKIHQTSVSDRNFGSQFVLRNNEFTLTPPIIKHESPICMGGQDLVALRNPVHSLTSDKYPLW